MSTIRRKPVPTTPASLEDVKSREIDAAGTDALSPKVNMDDSAESTIPIPVVKDDETFAHLDAEMEQLDLEADNDDFFQDIGETQPSTISAQTPDSKKTKLKAALGEVKHFAGGLMAHPYEATKHYSILRHSHGLVFYQGLNTRIAITVLSDQPLPVDRQLWLQKRGLSGNTGLKMGATFGSRSAWIDVTPSVEATTDQLDASDERAWQRDINKFLKKARDVKNLKHHRPYETDIVRIPHIAEDGYFRVVLCSGKKALCSSPIFRYASSSSNPGMVRGASLGTLPLELGAKLGSFIATTASQGLYQPVTTSIQNATQPYQMDGLTQFTAETAYDMSGAADKVDSGVDSINEQYDNAQQLAYSSAETGTVNRSSSQTLNSGPQSPFPLEFSGNVVRGKGKSSMILGFPTANIANVPDDTVLRLNGAYFAWASLATTKSANLSPRIDEFRDIWFKAIVLVKSIQDGEIKVVQGRSVSVHLINDFESVELVGAKLNIMLMGFLHALESSEQSSPLTNTMNSQEEFANDIQTTLDVLEHPSWGAERTLDRVKTASSGGSFTERMARARRGGQKQLSKLPIDRFGIRTENMGLKDQLVGNGGIYVRR